MISLIDEKLEQPSDLTVDYIKSRLYWVDRAYDHVESCDYHGARRSVCFCLELVFHLLKFICIESLLRQEVKIFRILLGSIFLRIIFFLRMMLKVLYFKFDDISIRIHRLSSNHRHSFVHEASPFITKLDNLIELIRVTELKMGVVNNCVC